MDPPVGQPAWSATRGQVMLLVGLLFCTSVLSGCGQPGLREMPPPLQSDVSYRVELPGGEGRHELSAGQSVAQPPGPQEDQPLPEYPSQWLGRIETPVEVASLVSVNERGEVSAVDAAIAHDVSGCGDDCTGSFTQAVRAALARWQFQPLQITDWVDGPDEDGDGEADSVTRGVVETRPYSLRLRFDFVWVDGRAQVSALPN